MRFFVVHIQIGLCRGLRDSGSPKISHDSPVIQRAWAFDVSTIETVWAAPNHSCINRSQPSYVGLLG